MDNTPRTPTVRDTAQVTVSTPVDGSKKRRPRALEARRRSTTTFALQVDPRVLAAAQAALRPGERLVVNRDGSMSTEYR